MNTCAILFMFLLPPAELIVQANIQAQPSLQDENGADTVLVVTSHKIDGGTLTLDYEVRNNSKEDIWTCDSVSQGCNFEAYLDEDAQTLLVRKTLSVPSSVFHQAQPFGKYVRLPAGEKTVESLHLPLPVECIFKYGSRKSFEGIVIARRMSIEIGYYVGDLPEMLLNMLRKTEQMDLDEALLFETWFFGTLGFNTQNEILRLRDQQVLVPYTQHRLNAERTLRTIITDLRIPYRETRERTEYRPPELAPCTRLEIQYVPSMLEYFYASQDQQDLLNREEVQYLRLERSVAIENAKEIDGFANELKQAQQMVGVIVSEKSKAEILCYRDSERVTSLRVYDDTTIETEQEHRIKFRSSLQSLRAITPQIHPFELRTRCAANLKNLWYRMRLYDRAEKSRVRSFGNMSLMDPNELEDLSTMSAGSWHARFEEEIPLAFERDKRRARKLYAQIGLAYPVPRDWCDSMEWSFVGPEIRSRKHEVESKMKVHVCPAVGEGMSTYAMNPNCRPDSPPDIVLLFETKAGWNQHGGPELFTFDNHDPKGGCVLLNDGTVKFIRTQEELQQLRWK